MAPIERSSDDFKPLTQREHCHWTDCDQPTQRAVSFPATVSGLAPFTFSYCAEHADEIVRDGLAFFGARDA